MVYVKSISAPKGASKIQNDILSKIHYEDIETISFKRWQQVDRCSIDTVQMDSNQFVDLFCEKMKKLVPHHFITDYQSKYLKQLKLNLKAGECIIICDFSENYSFLVQDAIQGFHWANTPIRNIL